MKFAFVADTKLLIDAHLVPVAAIGYKAILQKYTTMDCGSQLRKTTTLGGVLFACFLRHFRQEVAIFIAELIDTTMIHKYNSLNRFIRKECVLCE